MTNIWTPGINRATWLAFVAIQWGSLAAIAATILVAARLHNSHVRTP